MSTILLVEDHPLNRRLVRDLLETAGHTVIEAVGVDDGRARLAETRFDLALVDIQIPGGGGESLLASMRADPRTRDIPAVAVTALAMPGDAQRLLAAGFDAYVSKPIDVRDFRALVARLASAPPAAAPRS